MTVSPLPAPEKTRPKPTFESSYWLTLVDYSLRCALAGSLRLRLVNNWAFWLLNVGLAVVLIAIQQSREATIKKKYNIDESTVLIPEVTSLSLLLWLAASASGAWVTSELYGGLPPWQHLLLGVSVFALYGSYLAG